MARTVLVGGDAPRPWPTAQGACDFCSRATRRGVKHDLCPGEIKNAAGAPGSVWRCACHAAGHRVEG
jgi:hypothetical protein